MGLSIVHEEKPNQSQSCLFVSGVGGEVAIGPLPGQYVIRSMPVVTAAAAKICFFSPAAG